MVLAPLSVYRNANSGGIMLHVREEIYTQSAFNKCTFGRSYVGLDFCNLKKM